MVSDATMPVLLAREALSPKSLASGAPSTSQRFRAEFKVLITKSDRVDGKLGLNVARVGQALKVKNITEGLIWDWNRQNPDREVRPQDKIVQVNGIRGTADEVLYMIGTEMNIELVVARICTSTDRLCGLPPISEPDNESE